MSEYAVSMQGICKEFGNVTVLDNVDFHLEKGEILALVGGNGAGKSTLMKILNGVYSSNSGRISINGKEVKISNPVEAKKHGIRMIYQEMSLVPTLTVVENIFLNHEYKKGIGIDKKAMTKKAKELLHNIGVDIDVKKRVMEYQVGIWQLIEIAKALSAEASVLIMDEPTTALTAEETETLFGIMRNLQKEGISIIYISHRLKEIIEIADRITVLRDGKIMSNIKKEDFDMKHMIDDIIGKKVEDIMVYKDREKPIGDEVCLSVENLSWEGNPNSISFDLRKGEVLGLVGLLGSGRTEVMEVLFGLRKQEDALIKLHGEKIKIRSVKDAVNNGIVLIPEDRRRQGLVLMHTLKENISIPNFDKVVKGISINKKLEKKLSSECVEEFNIKTDSIEKHMINLSGGNQQKVVISKWFKTEPEILLMDEPTAGVDIGAKGEIVDMVREFSEKGKSVIFISSELPEVLAICDRVIILEDGKIKSELIRENIKKEEELQYELQN